MRRAIILFLVGMAALVGITRVPVRAQADAQPLAFEVASVKQNKSTSGRFSMSAQPGGRFSASNVTLEQFIRVAYQLQDYQLSGGPSWLGSDRFDVEAKAGVDITDAFTSERRPGPSALHLMLRTLMADRFKLAVHTGCLELPVYALVVARRDGRLGPNLVRSTVDCAVAVAADGRGNTPPPDSRSPNGPCSFGGRPGTFTARTTTMFQFANGLATFVNRTVLDRTELPGNFDLDLTWTPDQMPQRAPGATDPSPVDSSGPSIFTAVQEQLGLKLESTRGPVDVIVIDHVEHPTEN
jgi:uncharacterized protein (TIGR03435 family)